MTGPWQELKTLCSRACIPGAGWVVFSQLGLHFQGSACGEQTWALLGPNGKPAAKAGCWDVFNQMQPPAPPALSGSAR